MILTHAILALAGESATCEYDFEWVTPAACPAKRVIGNDCTLITPTGQKIDLNPLAAESWHVVDPVSGHNYEVNACGTLKSDCREGSGACQFASNKQTYDMGTATKTVQLVKEHVNMVYEGGESRSRGICLVLCCSTGSWGYGGPRSQFSLGAMAGLVHNSLVVYR